MVATTNKVSSFNGQEATGSPSHISQKSYQPLVPISAGAPITLPETNIAPENGWLEDVFPIETSFFMCYVSVRECKTWEPGGGGFC